MANVHQLIHKINNQTYILPNNQLLIANQYYICKSIIPV